MEKLLMITFRQSLEHDFAQKLHELEMKTYTMISGVSGMGESGAAPSRFGWSGANSIIFLVLNEEQEKFVVEKLKSWHDQLAEHHPSLKIPLRIFVLPCNQIL